MRIVKGGRVRCARPRTLPPVRARPPPPCALRGAFAQVTSSATHLLDRERIAVARPLIA